MRDWLLWLFNPPVLRGFVHRTYSSDLKLALLLCLPATILAIALRGWLLVYMPASFVHNDTSALVETAHTLLTDKKLEIEDKKTFLAPILYCLPALLHIPILPFLAIFQHLLGMVSIFLGGLLVYSWFRFWRWLLVPVTIALALNPVMLWYEHAALPETYAILGILLVAFTTTVFYRVPNRYTFVLVLFAILFMAGARPEGRLFAFFAIALFIRIFWRQWRKLCIAGTLSLIWIILIFTITRTGQSGLLLLTSVIHLTPGKLIFSPGIAEILTPLSAQAQADWAKSEPKLVPLRKEISRKISAHTGSKDLVDITCKRAGLEIALRRSGALPELALRKFIMAHRELPSPDFNTYAIDGQLDTLYGDDNEPKNNLRITRLLWGQDFPSPIDARSYLEDTYQPLPSDILSHWLQMFVTASIAPLIPWPLPGSSAPKVPISGLPWIYTCALLGLTLLAFRDPRALNYHQLWGIFLISLWLAIMVTANIRARFRILFEPLWILYAFALLDSLLILISHWRHQFGISFAK